jgi:hypothetical protein
MGRYGTTVQIDSTDLHFIVLRGARSHRGGGPYSLAVVLRRSLKCLRILLERANPYVNGRLPEQIRPWIANALPDAWELSPFEVERLHELLERAPGFETALAAGGLDAAGVLAGVSALTLQEKWALADLAVQDQAAARSSGSSEAQPTAP